MSRVEEKFTVGLHLPAMLSCRQSVEVRERKMVVKNKERPASFSACRVRRVADERPSFLPPSFRLLYFTFHSIDKFMYIGRKSNNTPIGNPSAPAQRPTRVTCDD